MAIDFIKVDQTIATAKFASHLVECVRTFRSAVDKLDHVKDIMEHSNDGADFTGIEELFGLALGEGQTVYDLINGTYLAVTGAAQNSNTMSLISRVG